MGVPLVRLDEVAEVRLGRQRSPKNHAGTDMRPYVRAANVGWDGLILDDVKTMNFTDREMKVYRLKPGDLLLGEASGSPKEVGKPAIWNGEIEECAFQNTLLRVRPRIAEPRYLLHFFKHEARSGNFASQSRGVGIHHLGREALASWLVPLPSLDEQRRIARILDQAETLETKRRATLREIDALTQSVFLDTIGDPVGNPLGWPLTALGDLLTFQQYGHRFYNQPYSSDGIRVIRITDLSDTGEIDFSDMPRQSVTSEERAKLALQPGDLIFARSGSVGKVAVIRFGDPECIAGAYFITMRFDRRVEPTYMKAVLSSRSIRAIISKQARQAVQQNFSGPSLRRLSVPLPPLALQRRFSEHLTASEEHRVSHELSLGHLNALLASLRQRAFRGEL
jgi:type I restriction enzyme, S subunit